LKLQFKNRAQDEQHSKSLRKWTPEELAERRRISALQDEVRMATHSVCDRISPERAAAILVSNADLQAIANLQDPFELHLVDSLDPPKNLQSSFRVISPFPPDYLVTSDPVRGCESDCRRD